MAIIPIYSRRKQEASGVKNEVYVYDRIPDALRVQVRRILEDAIGYYWDPDPYCSPLPNNNHGWELIRDAVARELGKLSLDSRKNPYEDCIGFIHSQQNIDQWLSLVEVAIRYIDNGVGKLKNYELREYGIKQTAKDAIEELNTRFIQAGVGYQYVNGEIIRIDNQLAHSEITLPALNFLSDSRFKGAEAEFLSAHAHYKAGEYKDCITDANNAFESVMKAICSLKNWSCEGSRATDLIKVLRKNGLIPDYLDGAFEQLAATLSSGLPKVRNSVAAHGQGAEIQHVPAYIAGYALHLTASKIIFLVQAFNDSEKAIKTKAS